MTRVSILLAAAITITMLGTSAAQQPGAGKSEIIYFTDDGSVWGSWEYDSAAEAKSALERQRNANRKLGWGEVKAQVVPKGQKPDLVGDKVVYPSVFPSQLGDILAADEQALLIQRSRQENVMRDLKTERNRIVVERAELDALRDAIARDTNAMLGGSEKQRRRLEAEIEELTEAYHQKLNSIESSQQDLRKRADKFKADQEKVVKVEEEEFDFAEPYTPEVVRVRERETERPEKPEPKRRESSRERSSERASSSLAGTTWSGDYKQLRFYSGGRVDWIEDGITASSTWQQSGNTVYIYLGGPGGLRYDATIQGNRMTGRSARHPGLGILIDVRKQ